MNKKPVVLVFVVWVVICTVFIGCQNTRNDFVPGDDGTIVPSPLSGTPFTTNSDITIQSTVIITQSLTASLTSSVGVSTSTQIPSNTHVPLPEPSGVSTPTAEVVDSGSLRTNLVCDTNLMITDIDDHLDIVGIEDIQFVDEDNLRVTGVLNRSPESSQYIWDYWSGLVDLNLESFELETSGSALLLLNPCFQVCEYDVLDQSPNGSWQIIRVFDQGEDVNGIWLVHEEHKLQLVNFVPSSISWGWADDGSLLWFYYSSSVFGVPIKFIQLASPPVLIELEKNESNPLEITYYEMAFSPESLITLSTRRNQRNIPNRESDELYIYDLTQNFTEPIGIESIPGIDGVDWNRATGSFLLYLVSGNGIEILEWEGMSSWRIPSGYRPEPDHIAMSPSKQRIAFTLDNNQVLVFECR